MALFEGAVALALFVWDPFGLSDQKDRSVDHFVGVVSQYLYQSRVPDRLAVVLIDADTLKYLDHDWPLTYADLAGIGARIACAGAEAVFFDVILAREYNLAGGAEKIWNLVNSDGDYHCKDAGTHKRIPVFFARVPEVKTRLSNDLEKIDRTFLVETTTTANVYTAGPTQFSAHVPLATEVTPAFGLFRWFCGDAASHHDVDPNLCPADKSPAYSSKPLFLTWNGNTPPGQRVISAAENCVDSAETWYWHGLRAVVFSEDKKCPPILTLRGTDLYRDRNYIETHGVDPARYLAKRIVFVGVDIAGVNDYTTSLVHDRLPGVYSHATALDNLLTYAGGYRTVPNPVEKAFFAALFLLIVHLAKEFLFRTEGNDDEPSIFRMLIFEAFVAASLGVILVPFCAATWYLNWPISLPVALAAYAFGLDVFQLFGQIARRT